MIINSNSTTKRTDILIENYLKLLKSGADSEKILVLVQNSKKKKEFIEKVKKLSPEGYIGNLKIYSFSGFIYNYISDNWVNIENSIKDKTNVKIIPSLSGLEISQYIFKDCLKQIPFEGYNSKTSLLHQLFRRYSLINLNALNAQELKQREKVLKESYTKEINQIINKYKQKTICLRSFDYIRQINLFEYLYKNLKNEFEYLFLDDGDEITPAELEYIKYIKNDLKDFYIGYDSFGSSRLGYLGAINADFEKIFNQKTLNLNDLKDKKTKNALNIFNLIKEEKEIELNNIEQKTFLKRNEMIQDTISEIKKLINQGINYKDICIITPLCDEFLKTSLEKSNLPFNFISKNEKLNQNKIINYILEFLKIINDKNNCEISLYALKGILIELLKSPKKETIQLIQDYKIRRNLEGINFFDFLKETNKYNFAQKILELYEKIRFEKLSTQVVETVENFIDFKNENSKDIIKINRLLKQIYDFEEVFNSEFEKSELLVQIENTIISENPLSDDDIEDNSIVVSTIQKIVDYSYKTKYQFYLDITNSSWLKQDIGPLYNAWVMQKTWDKDDFELSDNIELTKDRTARLLYKAYLLGDFIFLYSSDYDSLGIENFSGIEKFFKFNSIAQNNLPENPITPRDDQREVLNYKGNLMSVSACAGSGKTTIMLLLIEKILNREILKELKIEPKNIFVLTFMESAARNFKERIKKRYPNLKELPNISTIHGLALRIIKENNNNFKINLDDNFEIIDEIKRNAILNEVLKSLSVQNDKLNLYDSAISTYKNELAKDENYICSNKLFLNVFNLYQEKLKEQNLIDYDDLLLLSLKLLKENKDVLEYYQNLAKIIIEDEAQDSSFIQQSLISLLAGKYQNIVRCGDINQAITSTFTNSDLRGFREFMKNSKNVEMDKCQRCATGILNCANNVVKFASEKKFNPFSTLVMKPVEGKNIVDNQAVSYNIFEKEQEEENFIINKIKSVLKEDKNATIAILLRSNFAISKWSQILENNSIKTYTNSDAFINNPLFKTCLLVLEYIKEPCDIKIIKELANHLYKYKKCTLSELNFASKLDKALFLTDEFDEAIFWDLNYFLYKNCSIYELINEIGSTYFKNTNQEVNISLIAQIAQKIYNTQKTFEKTVEKLREIQYKSNFSNIKLFSSDNSEFKKETVQIMTLHKSKGDEFDYVFIAELTEDNFCFDAKQLKLKENSKFNQKIKKHPLSDDELKKEIIEENFRLIYVGITRAKKKLYLTTSNSYKIFSKLRKVNVSELFETMEAVK